jgi:hypothetical protein
VRVRSGKPAEIRLDVRLPKGWQLDPATPLRWRFTEIWAGFSFTKRKELLLSPKLPIRIPFQAATGATGARLAVDLRFCRKSDPKTCSTASADYLVVVQGDEKESNVKVPVTVMADAP